MMDGVHTSGSRNVRNGAELGCLGTEIPQWGPRQSPGIGSLGTPEAEAKCEISAKFLTFSRRKIRN